MQYYPVISPRPPPLHSLPQILWSPARAAVGVQRYMNGPRSPSTFAKGSDLACPPPGMHACVAGVVRCARLQVLELINRAPKVGSGGPLVLASGLAGRLELDGVRFAYPSRPHVQVLTGLSFVVQPGGGNIERQMRALHADGARMHVDGGCAFTNADGTPCMSASQAYAQTQESERLLHLAVGATR